MQNKPKTNPIKPNFRKARMNASLFATKDYRKNDALAVQKNKPNSNPISSKAKMNANFLPTNAYENQIPFGLHENKPNQTQFQPPHALIDAIALKNLPESVPLCRKLTLEQLPVSSDNNSKMTAIVRSLLCK